MKRWTGSTLARNALSLMTSGLGTSALGVVFWSVAARSYSTAVVGRSSAQVSSMVLLATLAQLGLPHVFVRFLPRPDVDRRRLLIVGYAAALVVAAILVTGFLVLGLGARTIAAGPGSQLGFAGWVLLWTLFVVQDGALTGADRTWVVPLENLGFAVAKIVLLIVFASLHGPGIFAAWTLPVTLAVAGVSYCLWRATGKHPRSGSYRASGGPWREIVNFAGADYASGVTQTAMLLVLPLLVLHQLGPVANGYFYVPWLFGGGLITVLWGLAMSFVVESSKDPSRSPQLARDAIGLGLRTILPVIAVVEIGAPQLLSVLGHDYAVHGAALLRLVALSLPPTCVVGLYTTLMWLEGRVWRLFLIQLASATVFLCLSVLFMSRGGITGVGWAYLVSQVLSALSLITPVVRRLRTTSLPSIAIGPAGQAPLAP